MPKLEIPVSVNLDKFKAAMKETSSLAGTTTRAILKQFLDLNSQLGGPIANGLLASFAKSALGITGKLALIIGTVKLMGDAVDTVRSQLEKMVSIADKATSANLSPEFWQAFTNGAKGATDKVELFETALQNTFQALRPVLNPDWSVWDAGLRKVTAVEDSMRAMRELFDTSQDSSGFTLFRNAKTQDEQIAAVLTFMQQLQAIGQNVAALDLGDKLFGSKFTDQIRRGEQSIDGLLDNIRTKSATAFSNNAVLRAKELDDELKEAWRTVDQNLHPSLEALDLVGIKIKSVWVDIVKLMGAAAALLPGITLGASTDQALLQNRTDETRLQGRLRDTGLTDLQRRGLEDQLRAVQSKLAQLEASAVPQAPTEFSPNGSGEAVPLPRRRPTDAPAPPKAATGVTRDRLDANIDSIEKRTAATAAETANIDLNSAARERARVVAQLETVAKQANSAAGLGANVVTQQQRDRINEVATAYSNVIATAEKAKVASDIKFGSGTAFLTQEDVSIAQTLRGIYGSDIPAALHSAEAAALRLNTASRDIANTISTGLTAGISEVVAGTKSASAAFSDFGQIVIRAIEQAIIKILIVGPLMQMLQGAMGVGGFGFAAGGLVQGGGTGLSLTRTGGLFAEGGMIQGPGTGTSDSIHARVSNGEFIVRASQAAKHLALLHAINDNQIPKFADGGLIGSTTPGAAPMMGGQQTVIAPAISVTVQGNPGATSADHAEMGERIAKSVGPAIQALVSKELRTQMRPGGILRR